MPERIIHLDIQLRLQNPEAFKTHARRLGATVPEGSLTAQELGQLLLAYLIHPAQPPEQAGFAWTGHSRCTVLRTSAITLHLEARVTDAALLQAAALAARRRVWGDANWVAQSPEAALFEVVMASNGQPQPGELGIVVTDWRRV